MCEILISRNAAFTSNRKKQTPLHFVAHAGLHDAATCFLEAFQRATLEVEDVDGDSPLLYASKSKVKTIHAYLQGCAGDTDTSRPMEDGHESALRVPPVPVEQALELKEGNVEVLATPQTKCPSGHDLLPYETPEDDFLCSVCECEFSMGTILYGCRPCDYDLCRECLAHTVFHQSGRDFVAAFPELQELSTFGESGQSLLAGRSFLSLEVIESEKSEGSEVHSTIYCKPLSKPKLFSCTPLKSILYNVSL